MIATGGSARNIEYRYRGRIVTHAQGSCLCILVKAAEEEPMRSNRFIKECGPYKVASISQDNRGIRLVVYPAFPKYEVSDDGISWAIHRRRGDGGGPGIFTAIALAKAFEAFLNQPYSESEVANWKATLVKALKVV